MPIKNKCAKRAKRGCLQILGRRSPRLPRGGNEPVNQESPGDKKKTRVDAGKDSREEKAHGGGRAPRKNSTIATGGWT